MKHKKTIYRKQRQSITSALRYIPKNKPVYIEVEDKNIVTIALKLKRKVLTKRFYIIDIKTKRIKKVTRVIFKTNPPEA